MVWTAPPDREEAGSPNVIGAVALHAAMDTLEDVGWAAITAHDRHVGRLLREGLAAIPGVRLLGPDLRTDTLPVATFLVEGLSHALVAARLSAEYAIGVRHGCFCAHPYLMRLLGLSPAEITSFRNEVRRGDRHEDARGGASECRPQHDASRHRASRRRRYRDSRWDVATRRLFPRHAH